MPTSRNISAWLDTLHRRYKERSHAELRPAVIILGLIRSRGPPGLMGVSVGELVSNQCLTAIFVGLPVNFGPFASSLQNLTLAVRRSAYGTDLFPRNAAIV
jgi:hypothetical protein